MAILRHRMSGEAYLLSACWVAGRSHACDLRLTSRRVSGEHATIRWTGSRWELRDLNSRNGTFLDQRLLQAGETVALDVGAEIAFGDERNVFVFEDDAPPILIAHRSDGYTIRAEEDGVLLLPDRVAPEYIVFEDEPGECFVEFADGTCRRLREDETLQTRDGRIWRVSLPVAWKETWQTHEARLQLSDIGLRFRLSSEPTSDADDQPHRQEWPHVDIEILHEQQVIPLEARAHGYLLYYLARARMDDRQDASLDEADRGWVTIDELADEGLVKDDMVNVLVHRVRAQFRRAMIVGADAVIERRRGPRRLRIGVERLEIIA